MIENKIIEIIQRNEINPQDIEIRKEAFNGYYVVCNDKELEKKINTEIKELYFGHILDNAVKENHKTWGNFNKNVEKSYRNKSQIVKKLVSLSELLKELDLKIKLK